VASTFPSPIASMSFPWNFLAGSMKGPWASGYGSSAMTSKMNSSPNTNAARAPSTPSRGSFTGSSRARSNHHQGTRPEQIFDLRILDPACGSGNFLLGVYEHLEEAILEWARSNPGEARRSDFLRPEGQDFVLSVEGSRKIIRNCLHGVDIDPNAVEVTRMSLALRHLDRVAGDLPDEPKNLLAGIGRNIRQGNALVGPDIAKTEIAPDSARMTMPFSWNDRLLGFGNVMEKGGFHAVVGNPPYIEVKRCREWMPAMYAYLKDHGGYVTTDQGKTDIAMPFMEKGVKLLRPGGRLGFIIQNRFFKTEYGATTRRWLRKNKLLESIEDFRDIQVFAAANHLHHHPRSQGRNRVLRVSYL